MFGNLSVYELLFEIQAPLTGTGGVMITDYFLKAFLPAVAVVTLLILCRRKLIKKRVSMIPYYAGIAAILLIASALALYIKLDLKTWWKNRSESDTFVEDHYRYPESVSLTFPDQKRNLIYIYLESMEITFCDRENGGAFDENLIPELTALAKEYEDFSAPDSRTLNGGYSLPGTTWTLGAIVAQTSGLPLINSAYNNMETQEDFLSAVTTLGDILAAEGYYQEFLLGSDAVFGGRDLYYKEHGGFDMHDYNYALKNRLIPEDYYVFWGYEDLRLYDIAKQELPAIAAGDVPFHLTILTVDTHHPDGYTCGLCTDLHNGDKYANALSCASRQLYDFISWVQQQDFYENTTIVVAGDHPSMAADFVSSVDASYDRKTYVSIMNAPLIPEIDSERVYSTFDLFPTTLAAIGVEIEGNRLGLGTNLFSGEPTLLETYDVDSVSEALTRQSAFLDAITGYDPNGDSLLAARSGAEISVIADPVDGALYIYMEEEQIRLNHLTHLLVDPGSINRYYAEVTDASGEKICVDFSPFPNGFLGAVCTLADSSFQNIRIDVYAQDASSNTQKITFMEGDPSLMRHDDLNAYLENLSDKTDDYIILLCGYGFRTDSTILKQRLESLGLAQLASDDNHMCYSAVMETGSVHESSDDAMEIHQGTFSGNLVDYEIVSSKRQNAIRIGGKTYSPKKSGEGITIVVYDPEAQTVEDHVTFVNNDIMPLVKLCRSTAADDMTDMIVTEFKPSVPFERMDLVFAPAGGEEERIALTADETYTSFSASVPAAWIESPDATLSLHTYHPATGNTAIAFISYENPALTEWDDYLAWLTALPDSSNIVLLIKDDLGEGELFPELFSGLSALGIQTSIEEPVRSAWYAVIQDGAVTESPLGEHLVEYDTTFITKDGSETDMYLRATDWFRSELSCLVRLDKREYVFSHRGIHVLVFDTLTGEVTDTVCFDLYGGGWRARKHHN
ncbi:MAG: sulfatase-like hydrolase/transferase [Lachnospiraceae bacterium]|nr:sulfatase-like hydrolase/transferase [Lachnospiraceae bacterium]